MKLSRLVTLYRSHAEREYVKHGRPTSTQHAVRAATANLLEVEVRGEKLLGREPNSSATPPPEFPQQNLLGQDLPGGGGEPMRRLADIDVADLTRQDLRDYLDHLLTKRHAKGRLKDKPWTVAHINGCRGLILRMVEWAEEEGHAPDGIQHELKRCRAIKQGKTVARRSTKVTSAPENVVFELIRWLRDSSDKMATGTPYKRDLQRRRRLLAVACELMWRLGCRPQELVLMRPNEIHEDPEAPGRRWLFMPGQWKTEHHDANPRLMVVTEKTKALIDEAIVLRRTDGNQMLLSIADDYDPSERLFTWKADHPYHAVNGFYNAVTRSLVKAGLRKVTNMQIRHAFATRAAAVSLEGARVQLGHSNPNTIRHYLDTNGPAVRNLLDTLDHDPRKGPPPGSTPPTTPTGTDARDKPPHQLRLVGG